MADGFGGAKPKSRKATTARGEDHGAAYSDVTSREKARSPTALCEQRLSQYPTHRRDGARDQKLHTSLNHDPEQTTPGQAGYRKCLSSVQKYKTAKPARDKHGGSTASIVHSTQPPKIYPQEKRTLKENQNHETFDLKRNVNKLDLLGMKKQNKRQAIVESCDKNRLDQLLKRLSCDKENRGAINSHSDGDRNRQHEIKNQTNPLAVNDASISSSQSKTSNKNIAKHPIELLPKSEYCKEISTNQNPETLFLNNTCLANQNSELMLLTNECAEMPRMRQCDDLNVSINLSEVSESPLDEDRTLDSETHDCGSLSVISRHRPRKRRSKKTKGDNLWGHVDTSSDDDKYDLVFDETCGEVVRRKKPVYASHEVKSSILFRSRARQSGDGQSKPASDQHKDTNNDSPGLTLKHALPYLPSRLRNRLTTGEGFWSATRSGGQVVAGSLSDPSDRTEPEGYTATAAAAAGVHRQRGTSVQLSEDSDTHTGTAQGIVSSQPNLHQSHHNTEIKHSTVENKDQKQCDNDDFYKRLHKIFSRFRGNDLEKCNNSKECKESSKKCNESSKTCNNRSKKCNICGEDYVHWIDRHVETFEDSLEDPFRISQDESSELIDDIDRPLVLDNDSDSAIMDQYTHNTHTIDALLDMGDVELQADCDTPPAQDADTDSEATARVEVFADMMRDFHQIVRQFDCLGQVISGLEAVETSLEECRESLEDTVQDVETQREKLFGHDVDLSRSSSDTDSDVCGDADDEFEWDIDALTGNQALDMSDLDLGEGATALQRFDINQPQQPISQDFLGLTVDVGHDTDSDGTILDPEVNLLLHASLRQILEIETMIHERLSLQPDLFNSPATPAASQADIDSLPLVILTLQSAEHQPSCPICLSLCEVGDHMTQLPCQHMFHPACIRCWLLKSGTCPVCRHFVS